MGFRDKLKIKGSVRVTILDQDGNIKRYPQTFFRKLLNIPGKLMIIENHNIVTDEGDAMIADLMSDSPARVKVDNGNGHIEVGTGWTGVNPKQNTSCNSPTGSPKQLSTGYPKVKGAFGDADDNVTQYRAVFSPGDLDDTDINEVALLNNSNATSADCLAYAELSPAATVGTLDTLQIDWEITFLGA